jgi:hypothetical protein
MASRRAAGAAAAALSRYEATMNRLDRASTALGTLALAALLAACASPARAGAPPGPLRLRWASAEYYTAGPTDPVVELRIILDNRGSRASDSTTILWEPAFAQAFTFLRSEPAAWRVRVDERGWGVLDTDGVLPRQFGTFRLWFAMNAYAVHEPRLAFVANGTTDIAEATASATHLLPQRVSPAQQAFERGPAAMAADALPFAPADERGAFRVAAGMGVLLTAVAGIGGGAAFRAAGRQP